MAMALVLLFDSSGLEGVILPNKIKAIDTIQCKYMDLLQRYLKSKYPARYKELVEQYYRDLQSTTERGE